MTATMMDIEGWLAEGQEKGATHVVVVHDTYDHDNFPLYIMPGENARDVFNKKYVEGRSPTSASYGADECYDLRMDIDAQLQEHRANHWD
jgi:hypothetical protein